MRIDGDDRVDIYNVGILICLPAGSVLQPKGWEEEGPGWHKSFYLRKDCC